MKRYSEYKDSGVKWIGEIPGHWKSVPFRRIAKVQCNLVHPFDNLEMLQISPDSIEKDSGKIIKIKTVAEANIDSDNHRFYKGQILYSKIRPLLNKVTIAPDDGLCSADMYPISTEEKTEFIKYYMLSKAFLSSVKNIVADRVKMPKINQDELKETRFVIPPLPEQEAIVTYLDTKVAKIDEYISIAEKKIAALEELKQTIIAEAVTRGIHKDVPMKDSGVKWIGMIPEHWKIMRLRFVCEFRNGYTPSKANPKFWENGTIPWFRMEDIRDSGRFLNEAKQYISKEAVKGDGLFEAGSFILATTATIGEHAMLIADSLANQQFTNLKIRKSLISKLSRNFFFYYLFVIDEYCKSTTRKATFPSVDMTDLKNIGVSIPPIEEQQEIVTYLDSKVANINQLCQAERSQIEKLKEYKQRLISDVVTGKVKVTND